MLVVTLAEVNLLSKVLRLTKKSPKSCLKGYVIDPYPRCLYAWMVAGLIRPGPLHKYLQGVGK